MRKITGGKIEMQLKTFYKFNCTKIFLKALHGMGSTMQELSIRKVFVLFLSVALLMLTIFFVQIVVVL